MIGQDITVIVNDPSHLSVFELIPPPFKHDIIEETIKQSYETTNNFDKPLHPIKDDSESSAYIENEDINVKTIKAARKEGNTDVSLFLNTDLKDWKPNPLIKTSIEELNKLFYSKK